MSVRPESVPAVAKNRIDARFAALRARGEKGLIPFITAGDPDLETTRRAVLAMAAAGADLIELGLPYSDPVADGPVIQRASERSLRGGFRLAHGFELVRQLRRDLAGAGSAAAAPVEKGAPARPGAADPGLPILFMTYYNPVLQYGLDRFAADAAAAGADGLLVPDLPIEESDELDAACRRSGLRLIPFLAPTSTDARIARVAAVEPAFIYCVSLTGVTGARERLSDRLAEMVARIRPHTGAPLAAGFGISGPEQARAAARLADAVIVGSAVVRLVEEGGAAEEVAARVGRFVAEVKAALAGGPEHAEG